MVTIKDIARLAGVSQGTVSNVLNNKGSVRSDKIKRVLRIAEENGYTINESARTLRKGERPQFAVIVPNIEEETYQSFYTTFESRSAENGYLTHLFLTHGKAEKEKSILSVVKSIKFDALIIFGSCLNNSEYAESGIEKKNIIFVDQKCEKEFSYIGFDYNIIANDIASKIVQNGYTNITCFVSKYSKASCIPFIPTLKNILLGINNEMIFKVHECDNVTAFNARSIVDVLAANASELIITDNQKTSKIVQEMAKILFPERNTKVISLACADYIPSNNNMKYELDYKRLAEETVNFLLQKENKDPLCRILVPIGFNRFSELYISPHHEKTGSITVLTLTSPTIEAMEYSKVLFREKTGHDVVFKIVNYEEMYELLSNDNGKIDADILRIDAKLSKFFAAKHFYPLNRIGNTADLIDNFPHAISKKYISSEQDVFFIPSTPSVQILFYRKDLFDDYMLQRLFFEKTKHDLQVPKDFKEYNLIAKFFTRDLNPASPVSYGSTITIGTSSMASIEFLMRYFALTANLFDDDGNIFPNTEIAEEALADLLDIIPSAPRTNNTWWLQSSRDFAKGDIAMTIQLTNHASIFEDANSNIIGKLGWNITPGNNPILGGSVIGINKASTKKEMAFEYIKWLQEKPVANFNAMLGAHSGNRSVLDNQYINETYPWLPLSRKAIDSSSYPIFPPTKLDIDMHKIEELIGNVVLDVINKKIEASKAIEYIQYSYNIIRKIF